MKPLLLLLLAICATASHAQTADAATETPLLLGGRALPAPILDALAERQRAGLPARIPAMTEFESLAYVRETWSQPDADPYLVRGRIDADRYDDVAVVLAGPHSAEVDQGGWGWPSFDLAIAIFHGRADGSLTVGFVWEAGPLPLAAVLLTAGTPGLDVSVYETDFTMSLVPTRHGYAFEELSDDDE